jgi:catechol 2,3-dioxygenase
MTAVINPPLSIGRVALTVRDLDRVSAFYQQTIGFRLLAETPESVQLGTGSRVLLELRRNPQARPGSPRDAGLYHIAFRLPSRADLGCFFKHAASLRLRVGASDHLVSESVYLADPEGNGIEFCADRGSSEWRWDNGSVEMSVDPLNLASVVHSADGQVWHGVPEGTVVGHLNLQVGDLGEANAFYAGVLGFDVTCRLPGASFFASGGYHHHIATNIWNSSGAPLRPDPVAGLADIEILAIDTSILDAVRSRADALRLVDDRPERLTVRDPWGMSISLAAR